MSNKSEVLNSNFISFHSNYFVKGKEICKRKKEVVIRTSPSYSSSPQSEYYPLYCKYNLLKFKVWTRNQNSAWNNENIEDELDYIQHWKTFLQTPEAMLSVPNFIQELEITERYIVNESSESSDEENETIVREEWMYLADFLTRENNDPQNDSEEDLSYWTEKNKVFDARSRLEMPTWINAQKESLTTQEVYNDPVLEQTFITQLNTDQRKAFDLLSNHDFKNSPQLLLITTGKAGCGKSFIIDRLRNLLKSKCIVTALFGIAAFNVSGKSLHFLLKLPIRGKRNSELQGSALSQIQDNLKDIHYLIIDEFSVVGKRELAWINKRCKQAKSRYDIPFGGINVVLVGDLG